MRKGLVASQLTLSLDDHQSQQYITKAVLTFKYSTRNIKALTASALTEGRRRVPPPYLLVDSRGAFVAFNNRKVFVIGSAVRIIIS
ncbi:hypothetical protein EVAR_62276_1 [Eumeta japonica]|uniref:Uncharacterized protein n=1 Tax=Eumeta variegata TaxID=151549 RepID=A0A4C1YZK4_EUMVA|nr:hypothetical protein EVAR_62276_1 [Eumeta japonica]